MDPKPRSGGKRSQGQGRGSRRAGGMRGSSSSAGSAGGAERSRSGGVRGKGKGKGPREDSYSTLGSLVSKATKPTRDTGYQHLDEDIVRRIKAIAKQDDRCASGALSYLMERMKAQSSEVRFMALSVIGQLFQRSRVVRASLVNDLKTFLNLAVGHDARQPLPGPASAADALRQRALALLEEWSNAHGDMYKGLRAAYRFLREGKRMQFPELQVQLVRVRQEAARRQNHAERLLRAKYFQAKREIEEHTPDLETMVREMQECFAILVPAVPGTDAIPATERRQRTAVTPQRPPQVPSSSSSTTIITLAAEDYSEEGGTIGVSRSSHEKRSTASEGVASPYRRRRQRSSGSISSRAGDGVVDGGVGSDNSPPPFEIPSTPLPQSTRKASRGDDDGVAAAAAEKFNAVVDGKDLDAAGSGPEAATIAGDLTGGDGGSGVGGDGKVLVSTDSAAEDSGGGVEGGGEGSGYDRDGERGSVLPVRHGAVQGRKRPGTNASLRIDEEHDDTDDDDEGIEWEDGYGAGEDEGRGRHGGGDVVGGNEKSSRKRKAAAVNMAGGAGAKTEGEAGVGGGRGGGGGGTAIAVTKNRTSAVSASAKGHDQNDGECDDDDDDDEGIEWEDATGALTGDDADNHNSNNNNNNKDGTSEAGSEDELEDDLFEAEGEDAEYEEGDNENDEFLWGGGKRRRRGRPRVAGQALRSVADTVEAAGLGTSGYELQIEVPMGWSLSTGSVEGNDGDTALVLSALKERYKVLTSRILPLMSDWIQTLSRVTFEDISTTTASATTAGPTNNTAAQAGGQRKENGDSASPRTTTTSTAGAAAERRACALLLARCLSARNAANAVVSKFLELRVDEDDVKKQKEYGTGSGDGRGTTMMSKAGEAGVGGSRGGVFVVTRKGRGWGKGERKGAGVGTGAKKPRLQIRLDDAPDKGRRG